MSGKRARERRRVHRLIRDATRFVEQARAWTFLFGRFFGHPKRCRRLGLMTGIVGGVNPVRRLIALDCRYDMLPTLLHECFHIRFPELPEKDVQALEKLAKRHITPRQATKLLKAFARRLP